MKFIILLLALVSINALAVPQAKELLGPKQYKKLQVAKKSSNIKTQIVKILNKRLPFKYRKDSQLIASTIITNANKYQLDPMFVTAVIAGESNFNPEVMGPVKEIGLMQLRPHVAKWITEEYLHKAYHPRMLKNPYDNIRMGTRYLAWLRVKFNHSAHYMAAYNMGPNKLKSQIKKNITPKDYPRHIMKQYLALYQSK